MLNEFSESAIFQDLANAPAAMESARIADAVGCAPGCSAQIADAVQAYVQADLGGDPCWVHLPLEAAPSGVDISRFRQPAVRLVKALYGHPDSGSFWGDTATRP